MRRMALLVCLAALSACGVAKKDRPLQGYAEADYLYLSAREPGFVETLTVKEGDEVKAGALIFRLDNDRSNATLSRARAAACGSTLRNCPSFIPRLISVSTPPLACIATSSR